MAAQTTAWVNFNGKDVGVKITIDGIEDKIKKVSRNGKKDIDSLSASFKNLKSQISSMSGSMGSLPLIGGLGAAGIFAGGKTAVEKFAGRESIETAIGMFSKTEERTASNLAFLKRTSRGLGIVYDTAADGYKRLMQNLSSTNMPMEEQNALFKKISTVIRVSNVDNTAAESVYRAFGDMFSKGGIQAQELKTQLANAIGGVMPAMKQAFPGKNIAAGLDAGAFNKQIHVVKLINQLYANNEQGLAKAQTQTSFKLAIIQDDWANAMSSIGKSIVDSGALGVVSDMASELSVWVDANKELIKSSLKGGVDFVKKGFEWAIANKDDILSVAKGLGVFFLAVKTANLMAMFATPIGLAAASMVVIATAVTTAIDGINKAKEAEKAKKNPEFQNASLNAGESLVLGAKNTMLGAWNATPLGQEYSRGGAQLMTGITQMALGTVQSVLYASALASNKFDTTKDLGYAGQMAYRLGQNATAEEKWLNPQDFRPEMSAPTSGSYVLDAKFPKDYVSREPQTQPSINEMLKMFADAMSNMTQNVTINKDNVAIDYSFGATKGPVIESIKN